MAIFEKLKLFLRKIFHVREPTLDKYIALPYDQAVQWIGDNMHQSPTDYAGRVRDIKYFIEGGDLRRTIHVATVLQSNEVVIKGKIIWK